MSTVVQLIPLSEADRLILTQKRNKQLILIPVLAFASLVSLLLIGVIQTCFTTVFFLTVALSTAAKAIHSLASVISLNRDLSAGQKRVINAPVEDQNMDVSRTKGYGGSGIEGFPTAIPAIGMGVTRWIYSSGLEKILKPANEEGIGWYFFYLKLFNGLVGMIPLIVFACLGGIIGVSLFQKRKGAAP